jgi:hypothetical protein
LKTFSGGNNSCSSPNTKRHDNPFAEEPYAQHRTRLLPLQSQEDQRAKARNEMELFHNPIPHLAEVKLSFAVLSGITIEQTRDLIEKMNDQIVGVVVTPK